MKKWLILLAVPTMAFCGAGGFLIEIEEENALVNLACDPFDDEFSAQELAMFDVEEKEVNLSLWSSEILTQDLNEQFSFEDPLDSNFSPSSEKVPLLENCLSDLKALAP